MSMRAVIYARVSSTNDRQHTDRQVIDLSDFASRNNYEVVKVFEEHISGAVKNTERPVLLECLEFAESNSIDVVLCSELSRLGRNCDEERGMEHARVDRRQILRQFRDSGLYLAE